MKDIKKLNKRLTFGIILLGTLTIILNIGRSYAFFQKTVSTNKPVIIIKTPKEAPITNQAVEVIKNTLGQENGKGIIGVTKTNNIKVATKEELESQLASDNIREYRYSGKNVDNYIYFNCKNNVTAETASTSKCELWRVVGVFKETLEDGEEEEYVKIVKNDVIDAEWLPSTYGSYKIRSEENKSYVYWCRYTMDAREKIEWSASGLQFWLNAGIDSTSKTPSAGYLSYFESKAKSMLRDTKYYFGKIATNSSISTAYKGEREGSIWTGKIALMYPSDYGYSADSSYWGTTLGYGGYNKAAYDTSWVYTDMNASRAHHWLFSLSSSNDNSVITLSLGGNISDSSSRTVNIYARPVVSLVSQTVITSGSGSLEAPWLAQLPSK